MGQEVEDTLDGKESVWVLLLTDAFHEDGQVMMVVQLVHFDFPGNSVGRTVLDSNGEISPVVEAAELRGRNGSTFSCTGSGLLNGGHLLGLVLGEAVAAGTLAFSSESCYKKSKHVVHISLSNQKDLDFKSANKNKLPPHTLFTLLCFKGPQISSPQPRSRNTRRLLAFNARTSNVF